MNAAMMVTCGLCEAVVEPWEKVPLASRLQIQNPKTSGDY